MGLILFFGLLVALLLALNVALPWVLVGLLCGVIFLLLVAIAQLFEMSNE